MKLSKRGEYALRALIDLGIASELRLADASDQARCYTTEKIFGIR